IAAGRHQTLENATGVIGSLHHSVAYAQHVQEFEVILLCIENRFEGSHRRAKIICHEVANAHEIVSLDVARITRNHVSEVRDRLLEFVFLEVSQAKIQANTRRVRSQLLGLPQYFDGGVNTVRAQIHDTQVGIGRSGACSELKHPVEVPLCVAILSEGEGPLSMLEDG